MTTRTRTTRPAARPVRQSSPKASPDPKPVPRSVRAPAACPVLEATGRLAQMHAELWRVEQALEQLGPPPRIEHRGCLWGLAGRAIEQARERLEELRLALADDELFRRA